MIIDIPTHEDFWVAGIDFLNLAWSSVIELCLTLEESEIREWDIDGEISDEYWKAAQRPLATGILLIQQGAEFLLKGRIANVSPYLLITGSTSELPKGSRLKDLPFSSFKTPDAQDLLAIHDTVADVRLSSNFTTTYNHLRRLRNILMHSIDKSIRLTASDALKLLLEVTHSLLEKHSWIAYRRSFLETHTESILHSTDIVPYRLATEFLAIINLLTNTELKRHFGFSKRQRRYLCPHCFDECRDYALWVTTAQLKPNTRTSTTVYCLLCGQHTNVIRKQCNQNVCKGNVLLAFNNTCLTCYIEQ